MWVPRRIKVGEDCAGMGLVSLAARKLGLNMKTEFAYDSAPHCQRFLAHHGCNLVGGDILDRDPLCMPPVDVFSMTHPCVTFSAEGKGEGTRNPVGMLYRQSLKYIKLHLPRLVLYENVARVFTCKRHKNVLKDIARTLKRAGYLVKVRIVNTKDWGVPHHRRRVYLVGLYQSAVRQPFHWPKPVNLKYRMKDVLKPLSRKRDRPWKLPGSTRSTCHFTPKAKKRGRLLAKKATRLALARYGVQHVHDLKKGTVVFADIGCSERYSPKKPTMNVMHTLTATRGKSGGPWCCSRGRKMDIDELSWVQGIDSADMQFKEAGVSDSQAGGMLGNSMSLNVVERLLLRALFSVGLVSSLPVDRWEDGMSKPGPSW